MFRGSVKGTGYQLHSPVSPSLLLPTSTCAIMFQLDSITNLNPPLEASWNVMAHSQKPDFVFRAKRTSPFKSAGGRQFSWLLTAEVWASAVVMLDTPCYEIVWRVLATHCIHQFPLHFPSRAPPCAITFQLESTTESHFVAKPSEMWCLQSGLFTEFWLRSVLSVDTNFSPEIRARPCEIFLPTKEENELSHFTPKFVNE